MNSVRRYKIGFTAANLLKKGTSLEDEGVKELHEPRHRAFLGGPSRILRALCSIKRIPEFLDIIFQLSILAGEEEAGQGQGECQVVKEATRRSKVEEAVAIAQQ